MAFYLISYDVIQKNRQSNNGIYDKIDSAIQDLDEDAEAILASQWLIKVDNESEETIGKYILRQLGSDQGRIKGILVNLIESGFAHPSDLRQRFLRKLR